MASVSQSTNDLGLPMPSFTYITLRNDCQDVTSIKVQPHNHLKTSHLSEANLLGDNILLKMPSYFDNH